MRFSREPMHDDQRLTRYVLGLLPEEETERLDEATLADDDMAARLREVENDLVDAYVSGSLDSAIRARFEAFYLGSGRRREKVEFARRFLTAVDHASQGTVPACATFPSECVQRPPTARGESRGFSRLVWSLQAAAAVLLIACGALLFEARRLHDVTNDAGRQIAKEEQQVASLTRQLEDARAAQSETAAALDRARASAAQREPPSAGTGRVSRAAPPPVSVAIVLLPQTRSVGPLPTVAMSAAADRVAFELRLESSDFSLYQVALRDPRTNRLLWRSGMLNARPRGGALAVSIVVPARTLEPQHYSLELSGINAAGPEVVGNYMFQIDRQ